MRVIITGGAGHIGAALAQHWLEAGAEVAVVDDLSCGYVESVPNLADFVFAKCSEPEVAELWPADVVYHCAAYAAECYSPFIRRYNYANNLGETAAIVNHCIERGCGRLVFLSSMAVYGPQVPPFDEADPYRPIDPYGIAKAAAEQDIKVAGIQHGLDWCIIRPHNVYGPGQSIWQQYRNVFGIWLSRHFQGLPLRIYGDGLQERAFSYIGDILEPLIAAGVEPAASRQIINLGGTEPVTILAAAELLAEMLDGATIEHCEPRHEVREAYCTTTRSRRLLGYRDKTPLREGLEQMRDWAEMAWRIFPERQHRDVTPPLELERGLYPYWRRTWQV